jgi:hypothetical protein
MLEISEEEWKKLEVPKEYVVEELTESQWSKLDLELMWRLKEKKLRAWESKKKLDEMIREKEEYKVLDYLKIKYQRDCVAWFREFLKKSELTGFKKFKLVKRDSYCWEVDVIGIDKTGQKKLICSRRGGLVNLSQYRRRFI